MSPKVVAVLGPAIYLPVFVVMIAACSRAPAGEKHSAPVNAAAGSDPLSSPTPSDAMRVATLSDAARVAPLDAVSPRATTAKDCTKGGWCRLVPPVANLHAIAMAASPEGVCIGGNTPVVNNGRTKMVIACWDGRRWQRDTFADETTLMLANADTLFGLGDDSKVWRRVGTGWQFERTGILAGIIAAGQGQIWIASPFSKLVARREDGWKPVPTNDLTGVHAIAIADDGTVFIAGPDARDKEWLERWDGKSFTHVAELEDQVERLLPIDRDRGDIVYKTGLAKHWDGHNPLQRIGIVSDAMRVGDSVYFRGAQADVSDPSWREIDVAMDHVDLLSAFDGVAWAMQRPSGELWFKQIDVAPRAPVASPVADATIALTFPHQQSGRLHFDVPPGWTRDGTTETFANPGHAKLVITPAFSADREEAFEKRTKEEISKKFSTPNEGELVRYDNHPTGDNSLELGTYKVGAKVVHRFWCLVPNRSAWIAARIRADGAFDDGASSALATACGAARLD